MTKHHLIYLEGIAAFKAGKASDTNPYFGKPEEFGDWKQGWLKGREEKGVLVPRNQLVTGMIFDKPGVDVLALVRKDNTNTWECEYLAGDEPDEYVRHDYIFTDAIHGYRLVGFRYGDKIFWDDTIDDIQSVKDAVFGIFGEPFTEGFEKVYKEEYKQFENGNKESEGGLNK